MNKHFSSANKPTPARPTDTVQLKTVAVPNRLGNNANVQQKPQALPLPPNPAPVQNRLQTPPSAAVSVQRKPAPVMMRGSGAVVQGRFIGGRPSATVQKKATQNAGGHAFQLDTPPSGTGGQPLPKEVQAKMEEFFGTSFSDVRVHVGPEASAIGALAFTHGSHLYFAPGQYNPRSPQGLQLLGHEMTHVVQQRAGRVRNPFGSGVAVVQDHGLEAEADRMGMKLAQAFR